MTRNAATGRTNWTSWARRLLGLGKAAAKRSSVVSAVDARSKSNREQPEYRPRFTEGLESRRMLTAATPISFAPATFYNAISGSLQVGNFVNGGLPDIVGVDGTHSEVHVLLNNGDGTFHMGQTFYVPNARAAAVADFNQDGNEDIAVISPQSTIAGAVSTINIFYGNGNGTFQTPSKQIGLNYQVTDIAAADLNGDGFPDLIITVSRRIIILINKGDGKFYPPVAYSAGAQYSGQLVVGDFNGDGAEDVAVTRTQSNEIAILMGQKGANGVPNGTFGKAELYHLGTNPRAIAVGDFTNNGIDDLAVANADYNKPGVEVLMGNGDGTFAKPLSLYGGNFVQSITTGDYNGDGNTDIATVSFTSFLRAYAGNGDGTFQPLREFGSSAYGQAVVSADFNGDGLDDVAIATGGGIRVLMAQKITAPVTTPTTLDATIGVGGPKSITYRDVNGFKTILTLNGPGSATVEFTGTNLSLNDDGTQLEGGSASVASITATGTTATTTLLISPTGRNGRVNIGGITTDGSLKAILAPQANLVGNLSVLGTIGNINFENVSNGTITLGSSGIPVNLAISNATDENLESAQPIGSLKLGQWFSDTGTPTQISAPAITHISSTSQFEANLTIGAGGLSSVYVRNIPQGTWTVAGAVGSIHASRDIQLTLTAPTIHTIIAGNSLDNDVISTSGNIGSIVAGFMLNTSIYAAVGPLPSGQRLPESASDFTGTASIGSIKIGAAHGYASFLNSAIAAPTIGRLALGVIGFANDGQVQGVAANSVGFLGGADFVTKKSFSLTNPLTLDPLARDRIDTADFALRII